MRIAALLSFAPLAGALLAATPAGACSPAPSYRVPTNLELTRDSELILLARVTGGESGELLEEWSITAEPLAALKGALPGAPLRLGEMALTEGDLAGYGVLSNPFEFQGAHPVSYIGGCTRYLFPRGTTVLLFLTRGEEGWRPSGGPFSRWAEDVPGANAPWVELVKLYARAAPLPEAERRQVLEDERDRLMARPDDPLARLMAEDIARQLAGPNRAWDDLSHDELIGLGAGEEQAADAVADLVAELGDDAEGSEEVGERLGETE